MYDLAPVLEHYGQDFDPDKSGNQQVRCSFHDDEHASASVNLNEGVFNCFACGIGGDAIELIKIKEGVGFVEAKRLAESMAGQTGHEVSRKSGRGDSLLPRRSGHRPGRRGWVSPWARRRS